MIKTFQHDCNAALVNVPDDCSTYPAMVIPRPRLSFTSSTSNVSTGTSLISCKNISQIYHAWLKELQRGLHILKVKPWLKGSDIKKFTSGLENNNEENFSEKSTGPTCKQNLEEFRVFSQSALDQKHLCPFSTKPHNFSSLLFEICINLLHPCFFTISYNFLGVFLF